MAYCTQTDLENRLGAARVLAIFDDDNTGNVNTTALNAILQTASDMADAIVARSYSGTYPIADPPAMLKEASLMFALAMAIERRPEYAAQYGDSYLFGMRKQAEELCKKVSVGLVQIIDKPQPTKNKVLRNPVHLSTKTKFIGLKEDGTPDSGDFLAS